MVTSMKTSKYQLNKVQQSYLNDINTPWKMKLYFLQHLPTMFWWGGKVTEASPQQLVAAIPYSWRTQNPFSSTYFAAQSGIAELTTGLLVMLAVRGYDCKFSTLVTNFEAQFTKKATDTVFYRCEMGDEIFAAAQEAFETGEARAIECISIGKMADGVEVGRVKVTWSMKPKQS